MTWAERMFSLRRVRVGLIMVVRERIDRPGYQVNVSKLADNYWFFSIITIRFILNEVTGLR